MALVGHARVSTSKQTIDQQTDALDAAGVERIFSDKLSGARNDRPGLAALLDYVRDGDTVVVVALDRLRRSLGGCTPTSTWAGRMGANISASLAEYERELIHERSSAAREAAAARGKQTGRPKALTDDQARQLRSPHGGGEPVAG